MRSMYRRELTEQTERFRRRLWELQEREVCLRMRKVSSWDVLSIRLICVELSFGGPDSDHEHSRTHFVLRQFQWAR